MGNFFIIGNGFDLAHGLPTSYKDFRTYLVNNYPNRTEGDIPLEEDMRYFDHDVSEWAKGAYNENELVGVIIKIMDEAHSFNEWNEFEFYLGKINYTVFLQDTKKLQELAKGIQNPDWFADHNNNIIYSRFLHVCFENLNDLFKKWIHTVNIKQCKQNDNFNQMIDKENDHFLTFNYTNVLEEVYNIKKICHIHGSINGDIVIGHGNKNFDKQFYVENYMGSAADVVGIHGLLKKDINTCLNSNKIFFNELQFEHIYSIGFSFSDVDIPYINHICQNADTKKSSWFLSSYDNNETREKYQQIILDAGFEGIFKTFCL
ncbi:bacteriophage abortive infection AbiH family protein [Desulfosarcina sp. OttesenSCG-928-B08]|nr:bacteriophage abortive infection AbiH family protein [Desulfosarcina sp. OttesenSCG-928-B08]